MKIIRVVSGGHAGRNCRPTPHHLLETGESNRAWLEVLQPEIDVIAEIDEGPPPVDRMLSLERKIDRAFEEIRERLAAIEDHIDEPENQPQVVRFNREVTA